MFSIPHLLCGLLIGAACILPGLSGGALAASLGVYAPVLKAVNQLSSRPKESALFLFPFALGGVAGLFFFVLCLEQFFNRWPLFTQMVFLGLLMGGVPSMGNEIRKNLCGTKEALACAALFLTVSGLILRFSLTSEPFSENGPLSVYTPAPSFVSMLILFLTGFFSAATIVIPGISGSMLLMMLGLYKPLLTSASKCLRILVSGSVFAFFREGILLFPLALGLFAGIFFFAHLMESFLNRRPAMVQSAVLGLIFASPAPILAKLPAECFTSEALPEAIFFFFISLSVSLLFIGKKRDMVSS